MHIYAFGSICRGEIDIESDIDILAIINEKEKYIDTTIYSIYPYVKLFELWRRGNPFAWHLFSEAKIIYSSDGKDFIKDLGLPSEYQKCKEDCRKFFTLYCRAFSSIVSGGNSLIFDMSTIFLAIRNFATCFLLGHDKIRNFSRRVALQMGNKSIPISSNTYRLLERSRMLSIRGTGEMIQHKEIESSIEEITSIKYWMEYLLDEVENNG